ncbi:MAG: sugar ABC transporter ATP-binding protein [Calditrichaeota bacterium]|nr:sugar ABC transporter ATP-binding protein [Calditrichota bacterium]
MNEIVLQMKNIRKKYPGVLALDNVNFDLRRGEVHALVGENGAGKSTLIKILAGAVGKDSGEIFLNGQPAEIETPSDAQRFGIAIIYQEFMLIPAVSVAENIFFGRMPLRWKFFLNKKLLHQRARTMLQHVGLKVDVQQKLSVLPVAQQQMIEVAKALSVNANIIVMDEPSAVLTGHELAKLFEIIRQLKEKDVAFIYISHRLEEIFEIADRVTVLRDGKIQGTKAINEVDRDGLVQMMVGREIESWQRKRSADSKKEVMLEVENLQTRKLAEAINLKIHAGEILGVAGLVGSGRTELARAILGADKKISGSVKLAGKKLIIKSPADAIKAGIGFVPEDRKDQGLFFDLNLMANMTISNLSALTRRGMIKKKLEKQTAESLSKQLRIKLSSLTDSVNSLSGGNQQKIILSRWFSGNVKTVIFDEPTRGVDVAAKVQIHELIHKLTEQGIAVMIISSELPEILKMSDRIIVMREGRIVGEFPRGKATEGKIVSLAS